MSKMGLHDPFGHFKHKLWPKERSAIKLSIWLLTTKSQESSLISLRVGDMWHIVEKLSMKATTLFYISFQSKVYTQSYLPPKSKES